MKLKSQKVNKKESFGAEKRYMEITEQNEEEVTFGEGSP